MRRRFGAWMHRSRRVLAVVTVVAGLLILLIAHAEFPGIWTTYWQNQAQPCGTVGYVGARGGNDGDPQAATTCFIQAYTQCHAASLFESIRSLNPPSTYTYLIVPPLLAAGSHSCSIQMNQAIWGSYSALAARPVWVACADVVQRWYGLHFFGCGTYGDRYVGVAPLSQLPPGVACGDIHVQPQLRRIPQTLVDKSARDVVTCFLHAQQTCQPAWAAATVTYPVENEDRQLLLVEPSHQTCVVLELGWSLSQMMAQYNPPSICTNLVLTEHGLYVDSCDGRGGGQIVLPICGGQPPMVLNAPCTPVPQGKI
jgi:hypothetical protein